MKVNQVAQATRDLAEESNAPSRLATLVDTVMSVPPDPPIALQSLARIGAELTNADRVELRLVRGDELILSAASYDADGPMYVDSAQAIARRFGEHLLEEDRPLLVSDVRSESSLSSLADYHNDVQSFMGVPLRSVSSSPLVGTRCAFSNRPENFNPAHLELWIAIGWRVGWEVDSLDATAKSALLEVRRIGHSINNQLTILTVGADILGGCDNFDPEDAGVVEDMATAAETIGDMVSELRSVAIAGMESAP